MRYKKVLYNQGKKNGDGQQPVKPLRYAIYARCSSDDQMHRDFTTIDAQLQINNRHIEACIASAGGMGELVGTFTDEGKTGTNLNRTGWKRLHRLALSKGVDVVVVSYMSRLGRGNAFTIAEYELKECKVRVEMVQETFDDSVGGYISKQATIMVDGIYPKMVSGWVKTKQQEMVKNGHWPGGRIPFGIITVPATNEVSYDKNGNVKVPPRRVIPDPETHPLLLRAYETFILTRSYAAVQHYLHQVAPMYNQWNMESVRLLLTNEVYRGVLTYGPNRNEAAHPPVVPEHLWDGAQEVVAMYLEREPQAANQEARAYGYRTGPREEGNDFPFYLKGMVFCGTCGYRMSPTYHKGRAGNVFYYECATTTKRRKEVECPCRRVNATNLHTTVLNEIAMLGEHPSRLAAFIAVAVRLLPPTDQLRSEIAALRRKERENEKTLANLVTLLERGGSQSSTLLRRLSEVEREQSDLLEQRLEVEGRALAAKAKRPDANAVAMLWRHFLLLWDELTEQERGLLMSAIIDKVEMTDRTTGALHLRLDSPVPALLPALETNVESNGEKTKAKRGQDYASCPLTGSKIRPSVLRGPPENRTSTSPQTTSSSLLSPLTAPRSLVSPRTCSIPLTVPKGGRNATRYKVALRPGSAESESPDAR